MARYEPVTGQDIGDMTNKNYSDHEEADKQSRPEKLSTSPSPSYPSNTNDAKSSMSRPWKPGVANRFPYFSFAALIAFLALCAAVFIVLAVSNGKRSDTWCSVEWGSRSNQRLTVQVSVWLAIISAIAEKLLWFVFVNAVVTTWWTMAMKGRTAAQLHATWEAGQSPVLAFMKIFSKRKLFNRICLSSIALALFAAHAPLLQKASSQRTVMHTYTSKVSAKLGQNLPLGWSATTKSDYAGVDYLAPVIQDIMSGHDLKDAIELPGLEGCGNQHSSQVLCNATLPGVGWRYSCHMDLVRTVPKGKEKNMTDDEKGDLYKTLNITLFEASVDWLDKSSSPFNASQSDSTEGVKDFYKLKLTTMFKSEQDCFAPVTRRVCTMEPALVEYPVSISNGKVTLQDPVESVEYDSSSEFKDNSSVRVDRVLSVLNFNETTKERFVYTLGGVLKALQLTINSKFKLNGLDPAEQSGTLSEVYRANGYEYVLTNPVFWTSSLCDDNFFGDPIEPVLTTIRDLAFRSAVAIAAENIRAPIPELFGYIPPNVRKDGEEGTKILVYFDKLKRQAAPDNSTASDNNSTTTPEIPNKKSYDLIIRPGFNPYGNETHWKTVTDPTGTVTTPVTVYETNYGLAAAGVAVMLLCILLVLPGFQGFWNLGRAVTLAPIEVATALRPAKDSNGTNAECEALVHAAGGVVLKYGELDGQRLGFGPADEVVAPTPGKVYM